MASYLCALLVPEAMGWLFAMASIAVLSLAVQDIGDF